MNELSNILRKKMVSHGYLEFNRPEPKILVDENCVPTDIVLRERGVGENLIEDFMIQANECVATHIFYMNLPFIYRVHEYPKEDKIKGFLSFVSSLGYTIPGNIKDTNPKAMQSLLEFLKDKKEFKILSSLLLRNMQKAVYLPQNLGHYGLASKCYTHFTSPIRRYPDTTVHRLLRTYLFNKDMSTDTINHWEEKLIFVSDHSSLKERSSVDCEREVENAYNYGLKLEKKIFIAHLVKEERMRRQLELNKANQARAFERTKKGVQGFITPEEKMEAEGNEQVQGDIQA